MSLCNCPPNGHGHAADCPILGSSGVLTEKRVALEVADETIDINRCVGSVHVWLSRVDTKSDVRCQCGEFSAREWCDPDISRVQFKVTGYAIHTKPKKCPDDECIAYGACGHHGAGGSCLADVDEDAPTQPVIVTDPPEPTKRASVCMCIEPTEFNDSMAWNELCPVHGSEAREASKKMRAHDRETADALEQLLAHPLPPWAPRVITLACEKLRR